MSDIIKKAKNTLKFFALNIKGAIFMKKKFYRLISFMLCFVILFLSTPTLASNDQKFSDLGSNNWAYSAVMQMVDKGVIAGFSDGTFRPNDSVTREQFAKILVLALNLELLNPETPTFVDVSKSNWAYKYVETAKQYLTGYKAGDKLYFKGSDTAVREDMAVAIVTAKGMDEQSPDLSVLNTYSDKSAISVSLRGYIALAIKNKVMEGDGNGSFRAQSTLTRAEACSLIYKSSIGSNYQGEKVAVKDENLGTEYKIFNDGNITFKYPIESSDFNKPLLTQQDIDIAGLHNENFSDQYAQLDEISSGMFINVYYLNFDNGKSTTISGIMNELNSDINYNNRTRVIKDDYILETELGTGDGIQSIKMGDSIFIYKRGIGQYVPVIRVGSSTGSETSEKSSEEQSKLLNSVMNKIKSSFRVINSTQPIEAVTTVPKIVRTSISNGATNVELISQVTFTFSEPVFENAAVSTVDVYDVNGYKTRGDYYRLDGNKLIVGFREGDLDENTRYTIKVNAKGCKNAAGIYNEAYALSFTTKSTVVTTPKVVSTTPRNGARDVEPTNASFVIEYNTKLTSNDRMFGYFFDISDPSAKRSSGIFGDIVGNKITFGRVNLDSGKTYQFDFEGKGTIPGCTFTFTTKDVASITSVKKVTVANGSDDILSNPSLVLEYNNIINTNVPIWVATSYYDTTNPSDVFTSDGIVMGNKIVYSKLSNLEAGKTYVFEIKGLGNNIQDYKVSFTTKAADTIAPKVVSTSLANGATNVDLTPIIKINFSEKVVENGQYMVSYASVTDEAGNAVPLSQTFDGSQSFKLRVANGSLKSGTTYIVKVLSSFKDLSGNANEPYTFKFTTKVDAPKVLSTSPANGSVITALPIYYEYSEILVSYSEKLTNVGATATGANLSGAMTVTDENGADAGFYLELGFYPDDKTIQILSSERNKKMRPGKYTVKINPGYFADVDGNTNEAYTFNFTIKAKEAPKVISTSIANNATNVKLASEFIFTFSEPIFESNEIATTSVIDMNDGGPGYSQRVDGNKVMVWFQNGDLKPNTKYTIILNTNGCKNAAGIYNDEYTLNFTTGVIIGDVNLNGQVTSEDSIMAQKAFGGTVNLTEPQSKAADVNGDGFVNMSDVTMINKYITGEITEFPAE
ncbi:MAG TPA: hypothetical protein DCP90_02270 [Clostridiales bacterium]|nr:MAG: hypothetical protein A2Y22_00355 [Clostridiales bacterium GWD2_32_59]HAN09420.1 hypothetical protein [Clostridiales bacterium]